MSVPNLKADRKASAVVQEMLLFLTREGVDTSGIDAIAKTDGGFQAAMKWVNTFELKPAPSPEFNKGLLSLSADESASTYPVVHKLQELSEALGSVRDEYNIKARHIITQPIGVLNAGVNPQSLKTMLEAAMKQYEKERNKKRNNPEKKRVALATQQRILQKAVCEYVQGYLELRSKRQLSLVKELNHLFHQQLIYHQKCVALLSESLPDHHHLTKMVEDNKEVCAGHQTNLTRMADKITQELFNCQRQEQAILQQDRDAKKRAKKVSSSGAEFLNVDAVLSVHNSDIKAFLTAVFEVPGQLSCADCGIQPPAYGLCDFGVLVCNDCMQAHTQFPAPLALQGLQPRVVGTEHHKQNIVDLRDTSLFTSQLFQLRAIGNITANSILEATLASQSGSKPTTQSERKDFVFEKYEQFKYANTATAGDCISALREGQYAEVGVSAVLLQQLAAGSDFKGAEGVQALHMATAEGNVIAADFLIRNGAPVDGVLQGYTPLHVAAQLNHQEVLKMLLFHGANPDARAANGDTPCAVAQGHSSTECAVLLASTSSSRAKPPPIRIESWKASTTTVPLCLSSSSTLPHDETASPSIPGLSMSPLTRGQQKTTQKPHAPVLSPPTLRAQPSTLAAQTSPARRYPHSHVYAEIGAPSTMTTTKIGTSASTVSAVLNAGPAGTLEPAPIPARPAPPPPAQAKHQHHKGEKRMQQRAAATTQGGAVGSASSVHAVSAFKTRDEHESAPFGFRRPGDGKGAVVMDDASDAVDSDSEDSDDGDGDGSSDNGMEEKQAHRRSKRLSDRRVHSDGAQSYLQASAAFLYDNVNAGCELLDDELELASTTAVTSHTVTDGEVHLIHTRVHVSEDAGERDTQHPSQQGVSPSSPLPPPPPPQMLSPPSPHQGQSPTFEGDSPLPPPPPPSEALSVPDLAAAIADQGSPLPPPPPLSTLSYESDAADALKPTPKPRKPPQAASVLVMPSAPPPPPPEASPNPTDSSAGRRSPIVIGRVQPYAIVQQQLPPTIPVAQAQADVQPQPEHRQKQHPEMSIYGFTDVDMMVVEVPQLPSSNASGYGDEAVPPPTKPSKTKKPPPIAKKASQPVLSQFPPPPPSPPTRRSTMDPSLMSSSSQHGTPMPTRPLPSPKPSLAPPLATAISSASHGSEQSGNTRGDLSVSPTGKLGPRLTSESRQSQRVTAHRPRTNTAPTGMSVRRPKPPPPAKPRTLHQEQDQ
eukprot:m.66007 g.66007  ORF g.66007 m.66007 type:complete len:1216 (-) comp12087_c0_seq3:122-3769(-)